MSFVCSVFRRSTTLLVVAGEWAMLNKKPSTWSMVSAYEH